MSLTRSLEELLHLMDLSGLDHFNKRIESKTNSSNESDGRTYVLYKSDALETYNVIVTNNFNKHVLAVDCDA